MRTGPVAVVYPDGTVNADGIVHRNFHEVCIGLIASGWRRRSSLQIKRADTFELLGNVRIADVIDAPEGDSTRDSKWWAARPPMKQEN